MHALKGSWISLFLIFCVFLVGNITLYSLSQSINFPTPENLMQRFQDKSSKARLRVLKDYGFARKLFQPNTREKLEQFFLQSLDATKAQFEKDQSVRLMVYQGIWQFRIQEEQQDKMSLLSLVLKDPSPDCRRYGIEQIDRSLSLRSLNIDEFFLKETEDIVLKQYYLLYKTLQKPLPKEIQTHILKLLPQKTELHLNSCGLLKRMVSEEKNFQALELLFSFLEGTDAKLIKQVRVELSSVPLEAFDWVPNTFRQKILKIRNSSVLEFGVLLLRPDTYENPEEMRAQVIQIGKEALLAAKSMFAFNFFYILAYHQIWDPSFEEMLEDIYEESNLLSHQFCKIFLEWKVSPNSTNLNLVKNFLNRMIQNSEQNNGNKHLKLLEKPENQEIFFYYQLKIENNVFFLKFKEPITFSKEFHKLLFEEAIARVQKIAYSSEDGAGLYHLLKLLAPQMTFAQLDRFLKAHQDVNISSRKTIFEILKIAPKTSSAQAFLIRHLRFLRNISQIEEICGVLILYIETEEMYQKTYKAIEELTTDSNLGSPLFLEKYLRYLEHKKK